MLDRIRVRLGNDGAEYTDELIEDVLESAKSAILNRRYPFGIPEDVTEVPKQYEDLQVRAAIDIINRIGVEGETQHTENGITRIYEVGNGWVSSSIMKEVTPLCGVIYKAGWDEDEDAATE